MLHTVFPRGGLPVVLLALSACGGGGGSGSAADDGPPPVPEVERLFADGGRIGLGTIFGQTAPYLVATGESGSGGAATATGIGTIRVIDLDTVVLELPGKAPVTLTPDGRSGGFVDPEGRLFTLNDDASGGRFTLSGGGTTIDPILGNRPVFGVFGLETPEAARPVRATYLSEGRSGVFLAREGSPDVMVVDDFGSVFLTAEFAGDGTIRGGLIDATGRVDFSGDGITDSELAIDVTLDGRITPEGFEGSFSADAFVTPLGGGTPQNLGLRLTDPKVSGRFFGNAAESTAGVFGSAVTLVPPGGAREAGSLAGFFAAQQP
jgi:hypothetical protein